MDDINLSILALGPRERRDLVRALITAIDTEPEDPAQVGAWVTLINLIQENDR
jgi:hypothetical protein